MQAFFAALDIFIFNGSLEPTCHSRRTANTAYLIDISKQHKQRSTTGLIDPFKNLLVVLDQQPNMAEPCLLTLPQELKKLIYEQTFYEENGEQQIVQVQQAIISNYRRPSFMPGIYFVDRRAAVNVVLMFLRLVTFQFESETAVAFFQKFLDSLPDGVGPEVCKLAHLTRPVLTVYRQSAPSASPRKNTKRDKRPIRLASPMLKARIFIFQVLSMGPL